MIVYLYKIESEKLFVVASSHLYWNPKYDYVKYAQTAYLLKQLGLFVSTVEDKDPAVVVCGDFNSAPYSSSVSLFYHNQHLSKNDYHSKTAE